MSDPADNDDLLADVLAEASPARFREALFGETLRLARRRRHFRQTRRVTGIVVIFGLVAILAIHDWTGRQSTTRTLVKAAARANYNLVRSQPLPGDAIITTRHFPDGLLVASGLVQITTTVGGYREINDDELLALVAGKPAALIRTGPHSEELVFANPEDQKGFPAD